MDNDTDCNIIKNRVKSTKRTRLRENIIISLHPEAKFRFLLKCIEEGGNLGETVRPLSIENYFQINENPTQILLTSELPNHRIDENDCLVDQNKIEFKINYIDNNSPIMHSDTNEPMLPVKAKLNNENVNQEKNDMRIATCEYNINRSEHESKPFDRFIAAMLELMKDSHNITVSSSVGNQEYYLKLSFNINKNKEQCLIPRVKRRKLSSHKHAYSKTVPRDVDIPKSNVHGRKQLSYKHFGTVSQDFFGNISQALSLSRKGYTCSSINVPSLRYQNWHFHNIAQGYLLRNLLKNTNVNTLNLMRNLYFVIITTDTPNLVLEINFEFRRDLFLSITEDIKTTSEFCCDVLNWTNEDTRNNVSSDNVIESFVSRHIPSDASVTVTPSINTLTNNDFAHFALEENPVKRTTSAANSNIDLPLKKNATTSNMFLLCDFMSGKIKMTVNKAVPVRSTVNCSKRRDNTKKYVRVSHSNINETIFEKMTVENYIKHIISKCADPKFYTLFFKCMGHTLGCSLVSLILSIL